MSEFQYLAAIGKRGGVGQLPRTDALACENRWSQFAKPNAPPRKLALAGVASVDLAFVAISRIDAILLDVFFFHASRA
jgi:hypothetical protein